MNWYQLDVIRSETKVVTIEYQPAMKSTNDRALQVLRDAGVGDRHDLVRLPLLVLTDNQWGGRGQGNRKWISNQGNLAMTLCVPLDDRFASARLPLMVGLAICQALESSMKISSLELKWPNDLRVGSRKLGGILVESIWLPQPMPFPGSSSPSLNQDSSEPGSSPCDNDDGRNDLDRVVDDVDLWSRDSESSSPHRTRVAIIGIGVNVNVPIDLSGSDSKTGLRKQEEHEEHEKNYESFAETKKDSKTVDTSANPTISLAELSADSPSSQIELTPLVIACVQHLLELIHHVESHLTETQQIEKDELLRQSIESRMKLPREKIEIELPTGEVVCGRCLGLGKQGELIIETSTGLRQIASGNVRFW